jgi:hypothetical protein
MSTAERKPRTPPALARCLQLLRRTRIDLRLTAAAANAAGLTNSQAARIQIARREIARLDEELTNETDNR